MFFSVTNRPIIREIKSRSKNVAEMKRTWGERYKNVYEILLATPEEKGPLGTCRFRWKNNIKVGLRSK